MCLVCLQKKCKKSANKVMRSPVHTGRPSELVSRRNIIVAVIIAGNGHDKFLKYDCGEYLVISV